ncbi:VOC family protein [Arthrobacter crystallopoietes]|uniref:VOC family protein n=1 Tax=Crystallibacter crystallopoietes TaxID=37928 RepID=UPI001ABDF034|nr:VOC family protein [Arthrobacter crystallopoietes]QTG82591.1 VOC family protein [Arthrobacter crystallopoietes]
MPEYTPALSHFGVFVHDLDLMSKFYCDVFGMVVTDSGEGQTMPFTIAFLSGNPTQHHQLALATGRDPNQPSTVMQISFKISEIDNLREARQRALERGATQMRGLNHGNALSIYFADPEGNTVEVYLDTPWYVAQPHGEPLDLEKDDVEIWSETERICRADPTFKTVEEWQADFAKV